MMGRRPLDAQAYGLMLLLARHISPSQLAISPQCGFASTMGGNPVTEADERAKLRLCVEAAAKIWA